MSRSIYQKVASLWENLNTRLVSETEAAGAKLVLPEAMVNGVHDVTLQAPTSLTADATITIPNTASIDGLRGLQMPSLGDVAAAAAIPVTLSGLYGIETAAAETNTLAIPTFVGQLLCLYCHTYAVGDRVVTVASAINQTGNDTVTFGAAGDMITLMGVSIDGTLAWRVLQNDGAALSTA